MDDTFTCCTFPILTPQDDIDESKKIVKRLYCEEFTQGNTVRTVKLLSYQDSKTFKIITTDIYNEMINGESHKFPVQESTAKTLTQKSRRKPKTEASTAIEEKQVPEMKTENIRKWQYKSIFITAILVLLLSIYIYIHFKTEPIRINELKYEISNTVLNQSSAKVSFFQSVLALNDHKEMKIISCLLGPTGTGKTHVINILKKHVDPRVVHTFQPHEMREVALYDKGTFLETSWYLHFKMVLSDYYIIVVDDLRRNDLAHLKVFIEKLMKFESVNLLIILSFNTQYVDQYPTTFANNRIMNSAEIESGFRKFGDKKFFSEFNPLTEATVIKWLKIELMDKIGHEHHEMIIEKMLKTQEFDTFGLKGAGVRLALEISNRNKP